MSKESVGRFRTFGQVEFDLFITKEQTREELRGILDPFLKEFPDSVTSERTQHLHALLDNEKLSKSEIKKYAEIYGVAGVQRFVTKGRKRVYSLPIETFPNHINNCYLIMDGSGKMATRTMIDVGTQLPTAVKGFERCFRVINEIWDETAHMDDMDNIVLTHGHIDHFGNIGWHRQHSKAKVFIHELDARILTNFQEVWVVATQNLRVYMRRAGLPEDLQEKFHQMYLSSKEWFKPVSVDRLLVDDEKIINGYKVIHVPGHCPGHICLMVDNVLFSGDHIIERITPHQAPESISVFMGLNHYLDSLRKIQRIAGIELILSGHEQPITNTYERIHEIIESHSERLRDISDFVREEPRTIFEITQHLFPDQRQYGKLLALEEAGAHVEYLHQRGELAIANIDEAMKSDTPVYRYTPNRPTDAR